MQYNQYNTFQVDQKDCGVAAVATLIKYYGGQKNFNALQEECGTSATGTTVLGVFQALTGNGIKAKAVKCRMEDLKKIEHPAILHVMLDNFSHFMVVYAYDDKKEHFVVYDPREQNLQTQTYSIQDLANIWQSKIAVLSLGTSDDFIKNTVQNEKSSAKKWLLKNIMPDESKIIAILTLSLLVGILSISFSVILQMIIDGITDAAPYNGFGLAYTFLFILLLKALFTYLREILLSKQGLSFNNRLINDFFDSILMLPKSFYDAKSTGDIVARMNDGNRIQKVISIFSGKVLIDLVVVIFSAVAICSYSYYYGFLLLASLPFWILCILFFNKRIVEAQELAMRSYALSESRLVDSVQGIVDIKISNAEGVFKRLIKITYGIFQQKTYKLKIIYANFQIGAELLTTVFSILILFVLLYQYLGNLITVGTIVAVFQLSSLFFGSLISLGLSNVFLQEARVAFKRLHEYQSIDKEVVGGQKMDLPTKIETIALEKVSFHYPGRTHLFEDFSMKISKGEIVCLLGENGSGKTTIANALAGLTSIKEGAIILNDTLDMSDISKRSLRAKVGYLSQSPRIFNASVLANICMTENIDQTEVDQLNTFLAKMDLLHYFDVLTNGIYTVIGDGGIPISGGQKQMVGLLRALYKKPDILIFDEPTTALDYAGTKNFFQILDKVKQDKCILIVTHRPEIARQADYIYTLKDKHNGDQGSPAEIQLKQNIFSEMLFSQSY